MGVRLPLSLVLVIVLALLAAPAALAGNFTYAQPANFSAGAPGANPDHDAYGGAPWRYLDGAVPLNKFDSPDGLVGWTDSFGAFAAVNNTGATLSMGGDDFSPGKLELRAPNGGSVVLSFTSPLPQTATFTISGTVTPADPNALGLSCLGAGYNWSLVQSGKTLASGSSASAATIPATAVTIPAGGTVALVITEVPALLGYDADCATAQATLALQAPGTAPSVSVTTPGAAAQLTPDQVSFAGKASTGYGISNQVMVRVYSGTDTSGTPVQTLPATVSGGNWSVAPSATLADGEYTVVAQQNDLAAPPDAGLSAPVSFSVKTPPPPAGMLVLNAPGAGALLNASPTLTGTAGTVGAGQPVSVQIYAGAGTGSPPVRMLATTAGSDGSFSVTVSPDLPDGLYTAVATQTLSGTLNTSKSITIVIKLHSPTLTMLVPPAGGQAGPRPVFFGKAGDTAGDGDSVTLTLYYGTAGTGQPLGTATVKRSGAGWSYTWPRALSLGFYTAIASQTDVAGHTTSTGLRTFVVVPMPAVIGSPVAVTQNGIASVPVYCPGRFGSTCPGRLSIVTVNRLRAGRGPRHRLMLLHTSMSIHGATTLVVRGRIPGAVRRALLHAGRQSVDVTVVLTADGRTVTYRARRRLSVAR
jgi:hypothetical protein